MGKNATQAAGAKTKIIGTTTGRTSAAKPNQSNRPRTVTTPGVVDQGVVVKNGDVIETLIEGMWWSAVITGIGRFTEAGRGEGPVARARLIGAPFGGADGVILPGALYGKTWRLSRLVVHHVPLTGQGVRNLDLAAPPRLRNGRHFRKPANWIAICPHSEELLERDQSDDLKMIEEAVYRDWIRFDKLGYPVDEAGRAVAERDAIAFFLYFATCLDCGAEIQI